MTLAKMINRLRTRARWTQPQFARVLGVATLTVSRWERGKTTPDREDIARVRRLEDLVERLHGVMSSDDLADFMDTPHERLRNHRPSQLLSNEYGYDALRDLIDGAIGGDMA